MASLFALVFSSLVSWGLDSLIDRWVSPSTSLMISLIFGTVSYAFFLYWIKRLRDG